MTGPTAVGKTSVATSLAHRIGGEIVNADSMQVYRYMDIGTAKPTVSERAVTPFHLIDIVSPDHQLTVAGWKVRAEQAVAEIRGRGNVPIFCGGTGLYIRAFLQGWSLAETPAEPGLREALRVRAADCGPSAIHQELQEVDQVTAARLHPNDTVRIIRALEVYYSSGVPMSERQEADRRRRPRHTARQFALTMDRAMLYERIDARVDAMAAAGLEEEVRWLISQGFHPGAGPMRSLGYKEMVQYINGQSDYSDTLCAIKQNTRRYAKRQLTWFNADKSIHWIDSTALDSATVASRILERLDETAVSPLVG